MNFLHATSTVKVVALVPARFLTVTTYDPPSDICRAPAGALQISDVAVGGLKPLFIIMTRFEPFIRPELL